MLSNMLADSNCFVPKPQEVIKIVDVSKDDISDRFLTRSCEVRSLAELDDYLDQPAHSTFNSRFIFINQRNSWKPLQINQSMFERIAAEHDLGQNFLDLPTCFYDRTLATEEAYSIPITHHTNGTRAEICYTMKYPEFKTSDGQWAIRQSGIFHSFNNTTSKSVYVLFSPELRSALQEQATTYLSGVSTLEAIPDAWLHQLLFSTYIPNWRKYIASEESVFLPISGKTFSTYIDQPLRVGYDQLSILVSLQNHFLQMPVMLSHSVEILDELDRVFSDTPERSVSTASNARVVQALQNLRRHCLANSRNAVYLQQRVQATARLLSDTLSFRDQIVAKEQNGTILQLNKSAVFITMLTLLYLPASFVASFFGMNFFDYDNDSGDLVGSSMIWVFVLATLGLTAMTFLSYYWLLKHDGRIFSKLAPRVHLRDWKQLKRRFPLFGDPQVAEDKRLPI